MQHILDGLNDSQKKAVTTTRGPLLVVAGPGTGKTLTIVRRVAWLIDQGVTPDNILAVTFTNRAAREMQERLASLMGNTACGVFAGTFHVLGLRIIRESIGRDFVIFDREMQVNLLKSIVRELRTKNSLKTERASYIKLADRISRAKNGIEEAEGGLTEILNRYQTVLAEQSACDFDDLILRPMGMLENDGLAEKYRNIFKYIIVDEYQDINASQYRLLRLLAGDRANICAVGDSDQAIYAFRGADIDNFLNFENDFRDTSTINLTDNYRSTKTIVGASNSLIVNNLKRLEKEIRAVRKEGRMNTSVSVPDERAEGDMIIREIEQRMGGTSHYRMHTISDRDFSEQSYRFSDFAVIYRTNALARSIEKAFIDAGIPYQVVGGRKSYQAKSMADTVAYLKSIVGIHGEPDTEQQEPVESRILMPADLFDASADTVALMTMHMAKGLEFKVVFLTGVEDGLVPYTLKEDGIDIEEERRLFYVGMTRAKDELFLIHSRSRFLYGQRLTPSPSPFMSEIPDEFIERKFAADRTKKKKEDHQMGLF